MRCRGGDKVWQDHSSAPGAVPIAPDEKENGSQNSSAFGKSDFVNNAKENLLLQSKNQ